MAGNNVAFALGLAQKAGKIASGDVAVRAALKSGKVKVLVLAQDAAPNSKKEFISWQRWQACRSLSC